MKWSHKDRNGATESEALMGLIALTLKQTCLHVYIYIIIYIVYVGGIYDVYNAYMFWYCHIGDG